MDSSYHHSSTDWYNATEIRDIAFPNTKLFLAVGDSGLVVRSTDKGETWQRYNYNKKKILGTIIMWDEDTGIMFNQNISDYGDFFSLKTKDGGVSWDSLNAISYYDMNQISKDVFCGTTTIIKKDSSYEHLLIWARNNWTTFDTLQLPTVGSICFINEMQGWIAGGTQVLDSAGWQSWSQEIYYTRDGGHTWEKQRDTVFNGETTNSFSVFDSLMLQPQC